MCQNVEMFLDSQTLHGAMFGILLSDINTFFIDIHPFSQVFIRKSGM